VRSQHENKLKTKATRLSSSSGGLKSLLGSASKALNLGLDASLKAAGDLGLFGAEIIGCSIHQ
jgi:hypothetical protein